LRQAGDDAQAAGIRHGSRHFRETNMVHAALNDRMLNAEKFSDTGFHIYLPRKSAATLRRQAQSANENYSFGRLSSRPPPPRAKHFYRF
jgi:hypothetical protein